MDRQEYLAALEKALVAAGVRDNADIIEEYAEHFDMKIADGYGEEEIAARLAPPEEIAGQFKELGPGGGGEPRGRAIRVATVCGVALADFVAGVFVIVMYAWVGVLGVFSLASAAAGAITVTGRGFERGVVIIPDMPHICAVFLGVAFLALAVLAAAGTEYCRLYVTQMLRKFVRWHKNTVGKKGGVSPPLPLHPWVGAKKRRVMRALALVSLVVFFIALVVGLGSMIIIARSFEPWHVWGWFV